MRKKLSNNYFLEKIKKYFVFEKIKNICVAVSGGLDSMVLLNLLLCIPSIKKLDVAHCNFGLRKQESDHDEIFIQNFCKKKEINLYVKKFNLLNFSKENKLSIQMAARKLRYDWFNQLLKNNFYEKIALGHHLNDSVETFFINIFRGTSIKGLLGIPNRNKKFIRPLSSFTKDDIFYYAKMKNISWREDSSNLENKYLRNKIRFALKKFSFFYPSFINGVKRTINYLQDDNYIIENKIKDICKKITIYKKYDPLVWKIKCKNLENLIPLSFYLFKIFSPYGFRDINGLKNLIHSQSGKYILSNKYSILKNRNHWILFSNEKLKEKDIIYTIENMNKKYDIQYFPIKMNFSIIEPKEVINSYYNSSNNHLFFVDLEKIQFPLCLRTWRKGDFFYPINMKGKKKISKYYKDNKFSILEKKSTWLLINGNHDIILIIGNRLDDRFKVTEKTKNILKIKI
ncbi:tRNA lysidine(34) synthetase TilS [Blattabacterium cuenoti]|uniref:tRNA lysidine(34) synthetase TilS n=1 Tax=Blattabacterium cuenoti TaxID=1653831 RepID=UPI00163C647F|nr:tRNA lysidine(34) synthetase TilS [Blattabacterium cuenoti]